MNDDDLETIKAQRDVLIKSLESAELRALEAERIIQLLILAGHVKSARVDQARDLAQS